MISLLKLSICIFILASRVEKPGCWEVGNDDEVGGDRGWREIGFYFQ